MRVLDKYFALQKSYSEMLREASLIYGRPAGNPRVALTEKASAGLIFSFGRDHGFAGRILNETVLTRQTLHVTDDGRTVTGFCFTPQDGNSFLSSIAASMWYLHGEDPSTDLEALGPYMFSEI